MPEQPFHGEVLASCHGPFGSVQLSAHCAYEHIPVHFHGLAYARLCLDGAMQEHEEGQSRQVSAGTLSYHGDACAHGNRFANSGGLMFSLRPSRELRRIFGIQTVPRKVPDVQSDWVALAQQGVAQADMLVRLCREWAAAQQSTPAAWNRTIRLLIDDNIQIAQIAEEQGMSPSAFSRAFARNFKETPEQFRILARLRRSIEVVAFKQGNWTDAAHLAGFADSAHLNRTFKRIVGASPAGVLKAAHWASASN